MKVARSNSIRDSATSSEGSQDRVEQIQQLVNFLAWHIVVYTSNEYWSMQSSLAVLRRGCRSWTTDYLS